jgi:gliding-associated putative ABC transporter substrate-binding component GldG
MKNKYTLLLAIGIILLLNLLSRDYFVRFDMTEDNQYTLSKATKDILRSLEDPVTVTAYFSDNLPTHVEKTKIGFRDLLVEYRNVSKGMVDFEFISPNEDPQLEQTIMQKGIRPVIINVREKDQVQQQKAYMGAVVNLDEQEDLIPFLQQGSAMEYSLSTSIKKLSVQDKPSVGLIQGHGEPSLQELAQAFQSLSILYSVENINLDSEESIPDRFKAVALIRPQDTIPPLHFAKLDDYLNRGGRIVTAVNSVKGDLSTSSGSASPTGVEAWLRNKGVEVEESFVVDASCGNVTVQQKQGFFTMQTPVQFPFLPLVKSFEDHPITKGLEQVLLPFASPIRFLGDSTVNYRAILTSSEKAGIVNAPTFFDVANKRWTNSDFPLSKVDLGAVLEGTGNQGIPWQMVILSDGDFAVNEGGRNQNADNVNLLVNSIDWLSDDTGLIELRTKGVATRPIEDIEDGKRQFLKYLNFGLPIALILLYGFYRSTKNRNTRIKRLQEDYS